MKIPIFQIDAFTNKPFRGNPAAVCPLEAWLPEHVLQSIAEENNLSETAFLVRQGDDYEIRWFTPATEVDLCGHATLAAAHSLLGLGSADRRRVTFHSRSGPLHVTRENKLLTLDFPAQPGVHCEAPAALIEGLGAKPLECYRAADYMAVYEHEHQVLEMRPEFRKLSALDKRGVIVTAPGGTVDFVSRFFAPNCGINEDPVTGSAHCTLTPYWACRLGKRVLTARQMSKRSGDLTCRMEGDRVLISGEAVTYMEGTISIRI